jgi:hypothetical protein
MINETLDAVRAAQKVALDSDYVRKAWAQATGLVAYDLEPAAKKLYPVLTPLRNITSRVGSNAGDTATRWKAITGINTTAVFAGLSEGNRGGVITSTVADYVAAYVGIGLEDYVTFEADYADGQFDDVKARAAEGLLRSVMIAEELMIFGGNSGTALGTTPTPATATATTGGTIAAATYNCACVALTHQGYLRSSLANGVPSTIVRNNPDGSSDTINAGAAQRSATASQVTTGSTSTISLSVTTVRGAVAYAWYVGTSGNEKLEAITTTSHVLLTALAGTGQNYSAAPTSDRSAQGTYSYDGLLYTALKTGSNAYYAALANGTPGTGTKLSSDGAGGITQIETAFRYFWDNYRLSPDTIWVSAQQAIDITALVIKNGGATLININTDAKTGLVNMTAGASVGQYLNKLTNSLVQIRIHPNAVDGTILFTTAALPYSLSGVQDVWRIKTRQEYYQLEWPLRTRKYEYGVYADEVLQHFFPPSLGVITNIQPGN